MTDTITLPAKLQGQLDKFIEVSTRNQGKPIPCTVCGQPFEYGKSWTEEEWDLCRACGFARSKRRLGTPKRFWNSDLFEHYPNYSHEQKVKMMSSSLWIHGYTGVGKTFLGFALCHSHLELNTNNVQYVDFLDLVDRLEEERRYPHNKRRRDILRPFLMARILFVDDVQGTGENQAATREERDALRRLVAGLNNQVTQVIFTSNYSYKGGVDNPQSLESKKFDPRTTSRLMELCINCQMDGSDRRVELTDATPESHQ